MWHESSIFFHTRSIQLIIIGLFFIIYPDSKILKASIAMLTNLKLHTYRINLTIHNINISVKFPCSVSAALKADSKQTDIPKDFKLLNGNAKVQQSVSANLKMVYNIKNKTFTETKLCVLVFLKSSSGRIPAGSATILVKSDRQHHQDKVGIEKCPDKTANIQYSLTLTKEKEEDYIEQNMHSKSTFNLGEQANNMPITMTDIRQSETNSRIGIRKHLKSEVFNSRVKPTLVSDDRSERQPSESGSQSQSRISKLIMKEHEYEVSSQRQKILELEKQKVKAMKEIRALKHQIETNSLKNSTINEHQDHNLITKHEVRIQNLEDELEKQKNKTSQFQTEAHKRKLKIQELEKDLKMMQKKNEQTEQQLKKQASQKDSLNGKNKQLTSELRQIRQKYEDILLAHENYVKRAEFKQSAYKEQLKTINDKYTASQSQKQKLLFQKNELINESEEKDKKEKDNYRNRERMMIEEKNKLLRKIDSLQKQLTAKQEEKQRLDEFITELQSANRKNKTILDKKEGQVEEMEEQLSRLKASLEKQINLRKSVETELLKTDKLDEEKKSFRRTLAEKEQQIAQLNKTKSNLEAAKKSINEKCQELQGQLKEKNGALKAVQKQFENLSKKYEVLRKSEEQKSKQLHDVTFMKQSEQSKVYGLNEELKEMEKKIKVKQFQMGKEIENVSNKIYELEEQNHEVTEKCFVLEQQVYELDKSLNQLKTAYQFKLTEADKLQSKLAQSYSNYEKLLAQLQQGKIKRAEIEQSFQARVDKLSKKIKQQQNQNKQLQIKLEVNSRNQGESYNKLSGQLKTYQMEAKGKDKEIYELRRLADENEAQIVSLTSQIQQVTLESRQRLKQTQILKDSIEILKEQRGQLEQKMKQNEFQLQTCKNEIQILSENLVEVGKQKQEALNEIRKGKKELQKFKSTNQYFLKTFFNLMTQPDVPEVINVSHDDPEIVKSMMQVLKKKKTLKVQYTKNVEQLNSFNDDLKAQIESLNNEIFVRDQNIEGLNQRIQQIVKQRGQFQKSSLKQIADMQKKIAEKDSLIKNLESHVQDLQNGGNNLSTIIQQKQSQIENLSQQLAKRKKIVEELQKQIEMKTLQSNQQIKKILFNTNFSIDELKAQLEVLKIKLQTEQAKRKMITITNEQHVTAIDQMKEELVDSERQKVVLTETIGRLELELKNAQQQIISRENQLAQFQANHNSVISELEFSNKEYKELNQKVINLQIVRKQLQDKVQKFEAKNRDLADNLKEKEKFYQEQSKKFDLESKKIGKQLENEKKAKTNFESKCKQSEDRINKLESQLVEVNKEVENLRKKINVMSNESAGERQKYNKEQENTIKKHAQTIDEKQKLIEKYESQLDEIKAEREFLQNNIANLQKTLEEVQDQNKKSNQQTNRKLGGLQKQNTGLTQQLGTTKQQLKLVQANLTELSRNFENYQLQNNTQAEYLHPISDKLSRLLEDTDEYLKFMNQFEASKSKLLKVSSYKLENYGSRSVGEIVREINVAAQRCKLQIINKSKIPQEDKIAIVEEFKSLQTAIEKVARF